MQSHPSRRDFLKTTAALTAAAALPSILPLSARAADASSADKLVGIQVGAVSFADEGVDPLLDTIQQKVACNAIFLATFTYGRGIAGRQIPGHPFPDHGSQESDEKTFHGGNYATPHAEFYKNTALKIAHAPDLGDLDILAAVLPKAHARNIKIYAWYEDQFDARIPGIEAAQEISLDGKRLHTLCPLQPDYKNFLTGLTEDYCKSYDIDGVMWGSERQGPFNNMLSHPDKPGSVGCFCDLHMQAAKARGMDPARVKEGFQKFATFTQSAAKDERPTDGYFVTFWRLLLTYPELLAYEQLWTDNKHAIYTDIYNTAKSARKEVQVGFHIWHQNSFSPFFRAEQDYPAFAKVADYLKIVLYNNCGGPRYARAVDTFAKTLFHDVPPDEVQTLFNHFLNYPSEKPHADLPTAGLSANYLYQETKRALDDVQGKCKIYPGIDIDIPTNNGEKTTSPSDVHDATAAALKAGAQGVIFSRKYSEMKLANLASGGQAVREFAGG